MPHRLLRSLTALVVALAWPASARADVFHLYVAARDTDAHKAAEKLADGKTSFWFPKLGKALDKSLELVNGARHEARVLVAQGQEAGLWAFPNGLNAAQAKLLLLGGHSPDWKQRDPFRFPSELIAGEGRSDGFFNFGGNRTQVGTLAISGFVMDAARSNKYDAKTNSLLKGASRAIPLIVFKQVVVEHLVIADNVFLNGAQRAFEVCQSPMSNEAVVDIQNNFFLNNVIPVRLSPASYKGFQTKTINFKNNSVILNWPLNPDPTSGNVGALELGPKGACGLLNIEGNLFAYNPGGALQHDWPTARMGKLAIKKNLFFLNATLFGDSRPEAGVFTGKFGAGPRHAIVDLKAHMEDDYPYEFADNVVLDPQVPVALVDLQAGDSSSVAAQKTVLNDVRGLFGLNQ
jgi:hypothetical protein